MFILFTRATTNDELYLRFQIIIPTDVQVAANTRLIAKLHLSNFILRRFLRRFFVSKSVFFVRDDSKEYPSPMDTLYRTELFCWTIYGRKTEASPVILPQNSLVKALLSSDLKGIITEADSGHRYLPFISLTKFRATQMLELFHRHHYEAFNIFHHDFNNLCMREAALPL